MTRVHDHAAEIGVVTRVHDRAAENGVVTRAREQVCPSPIDPLPRCCR